MLTDTQTAETVTVKAADHAAARLKAEREHTIRVLDCWLVGPGEYECTYERGHTATEDADQ